MKIFWSWQSDTHQPSNRYFVRDVLGELAKELNGVDGAEEADRSPAMDGEGADDGLAGGDDRIMIDHDTKGLGGSPRIAERILEKIAAAAVFVADVTPVAKTVGGKHIPNPNVMLELGYALHVLSEDRIVLVGNTAFDATLSRLPFDLRHRSAPAFYSLRRDASDERRAEVAAELKTELEGRIRPGLNLARKLMREDRRRTNRAPELIVVARRDHDAALVIGQNPRRPGLKTLAEVKKAHPPLRIMPERRSIHGMVPQQPGLGILSRGGRGRGPHQWTREETENYNERLLRYHRRYEAFLEEYDEYSKLLLRTFQIEFAVENAGTSPATGIDVEIQLPTFINLRDHDEAPPAAPEPPEPPAKLLFDGGVVVGIARTLSGLRELDRLGSFTRHSTLIDVEGHRLHFTAEALKHHHTISLDPVTVSFAHERDIGPFEVSYVITANEPIDPFEGTVRIEVERDAS